MAVEGYTAAMRKANGNVDWLGVSSLNISESLNDVGYCELVTPRIQKLDYYGIDNVIRIYRKSKHVKSAILDFVGLLRVREEFEKTNAEEFTRLGVFGLNELLSRRVVDYQATLPEETGYTLMIDYADDMLKAIVKDNMGSDAVTARQFPSANFSIAADVGAAPEITHEFPHENVLSVLQDIAEISAANGTALYFNVEYKKDNVFEFRTYINYLNDTTGGTYDAMFADWKGNISNGHLVEDYGDEINYVSAWGAGDPGDQDNQTAQDDERIARSIWGRREGAIQAGGDIDSDALASLAEAELRNGRPVLSFECDLNDIGGNVAYGIAWKLGSRIRVGFNGRNYLGIIENVTRSWDAEKKKEKLTGRFVYSAALSQGATGSGIP